MKNSVNVITIKLSLTLISIQFKQFNANIVLPVNDSKIQLSYSIFIKVLRYAFNF